MLKNDITEVDDIFSTTEDYIKISAFVHGDKTQERFREFQERWGSQFTLACTCDHWIDFIPPGINKGHAMHALLDILKIPREEIMAFGDNYNDLELLQCARKATPYPTESRRSSPPAAIPAAAWRMCWRNSSGPARLSEAPAARRVIH